MIDFETVVKSLQLAWLENFWWKTQGLIWKTCGTTVFR